ncbi:MAG: hypothetical protein NZ898_00055 [Myxococcota bacterium]|nr:hypothetical protein [Myxococcota bacterium]
MARSGVAYEVLAPAIEHLVATLEAARGPAARRWALERLERAIELADPGSIASPLVARARAAGVDPALIEGREKERVASAVVVGFVAPGGRGVARAFHVVRGPTPGPTVLGAKARRAVSVAFAAAERYANRGGALRTAHFVPLRPAAFEGVRVEGRSLGAAALVSALSLLLGRDVWRGTLVIGDVADGALRPVGGVTTKVAAAIASRGDVERIVVAAGSLADARRAVPGGAWPRVVGVDGIDDLVRETLMPAAHRFRLHPDEAMEPVRKEFDAGWRRFRFRDQLPVFAYALEALPTTRVDLRVETLTLYGAALRHLGDPEASERMLRDALRLARSARGRTRVPDVVLCRLSQHLALTARVTGRLAEAARWAHHALRIAQQARLREELLKAHGCAGLVALARGRTRAALEHQRRALRIALEHRPLEARRSCSYLIEALGAAGRADDALERFRWAMRELPADTEDATGEAWLRCMTAGALLEAGRDRAARDVLDAPCVHDAVVQTPKPGMRLRRMLALARRDEASLEGLAASPVAYGRDLLPYLSLEASLNVLVEARLRLLARRFDEDALDRAWLVLAELRETVATNELLHGSYRALHAAFRTHRAGDRGERQLERALLEFERRARQILG